LPGGWVVRKGRGIPPQFTPNRPACIDPPPLSLGNNRFEDTKVYHLVQVGAKSVTSLRNSAARCTSGLGSLGGGAVAPARAEQVQPHASKSEQYSKVRNHPRQPTRTGGGVLPELGAQKSARLRRPKVPPHRHLCPGQASRCVVKGRFSPELRHPVYTEACRNHSNLVQAQNTLVYVNACQDRTSRWKCPGSGPWRFSHLLRSGPAAESGFL
jgi:hypothetical protein